MKNKSELVEALVKEIEIENDFSVSNRIETIYFGGGTPSLLTEQELEQIFMALNKRFAILPNAEITLEANPDDINEENLTIWKSLGVNRLSLGIQSFNDNELLWMNRAHNSQQALYALELINNSGIKNYSADLIYGSPLLSDDDLIVNLEILINANVPHISCYALTVEPKTVLNKWIEIKKSPPVIPDKQASQFMILADRLKKAGYEHYEISNFALKGMRSRHNSSYWKGKPYYGFGPSAHSYNGKDKRRWNIANNAIYISSINQGIASYEEELLGEKELTNEFIMISLRTIEGINLDIFKQKFGEKAMEKLLQTASKYISGGNLELIHGHLKLTRNGKFLADGIAADLFVN